MTADNPATPVDPRARQAALAAVASHTKTQLDRAFVDDIEAARDLGLPWDDIGGALGYDGPNPAASVMTRYKNALKRIEHNRPSHNQRDTA